MSEEELLKLLQQTLKQKDLKKMHRMIVDASNQKDIWRKISGKMMLSSLKCKQLYFTQVAPELLHDDIISTIVKERQAMITVFVDGALEIKKAMNEDKIDHCKRNTEKLKFKLASPEQKYESTIMQAVTANLEEAISHLFEIYEENFSIEDTIKFEKKSVLEAYKCKEYIEYLDSLLVK